MVNILCTRAELEYLPDSQRWRHVRVFSSSASGFLLEGFPNCIKTASHVCEGYDHRTGRYRITLRMVVTPWTRYATTKPVHRRKAAILEKAGGVEAEGFWSLRQTFRVLRDRVNNPHVRASQYGLDVAIIHVPALFKQHGQLTKWPLRAPTANFTVHPDTEKRVGIMLGNPSRQGHNMPVYSVLTAEGPVQFSETCEMVSVRGYGSPGLSGGPLAVPGMSPRCWFFFPCSSPMCWLAPEEIPFLVTDVVKCLARILTS